MKKSMLFAIDAMVAGLCAMTLIFAILSFTSQIAAPPLQYTDAYNLASDSLMAMKSAGLLQRSLQIGSTQEIRGFLDAFILDSMCASVTIYDRNGRQVNEAVKNGCFAGPIAEQTANESPFLFEEQIYLARFTLWYK